MHFFFKCSLIDRCHIVILVKIMFPSLFGSFINHLHHKANNNVLVKLFSLICITSILTTIYSLKVCSVYGGSCHNYSPKSIHVLLGSILLTSRKNKKMFITSLGWSELCVLCLSRVLPLAVLKTLGTVFPNTDLPAYD